MIEVIGGNLFQWDTGSVAQVNIDANIHEVHFTTKDMTYAYVVSTYEKGGTVYCEIPNILLQQEKSLICYEVTNTGSGEMTVAETTLALHKRNKPQDYAYTQDELKNFDRLAALIPTDEHINGLIDTKLDANIPTKLSQLTDDIGAGGAKITSVNGILPDENGNVEVQAGINSADVARIVKDEFAGGVGYGSELVILPEQEYTAESQTAFATVSNPVVIGEDYICRNNGYESIITATDEYGFGYPVLSIPDGLGAYMSATYTNGQILNLSDDQSGVRLYIGKSEINKIDAKYLPVMDSVILNSSTADSTKQFKITVDDSGTITATEVS